MLRYGYKAPLRTRAVVRSMTDTIKVLYAPHASQFSTLTSLVDRLNWTSLVNRTAADFLDAEGINPQWTHELVDAATRVNYAQDVDNIHALEGLCSLAATGASSVKGGNYQIFEQFVRRSGATVHLNTTVTALAYDRDTAHWYVSTNGQSPVPHAYRTIVLAAPYHQASITFSPSDIVEIPPPQPYLHLHVTLLTTMSPTPNPARFNMPNSSQVPTYIMTSHNRMHLGSGAEPDFIALAFHGQLKNMNQDEGLFKGDHGEEYVVKIFSLQKLSEEWLEGMFGEVGWVLRKEVCALPVFSGGDTYGSLSYH